MVNPQLLTYVRAQRAAGVSADEIKKAIATQGWNEADANEVFASLEAQPAPTTAPIPAVQQISNHSIFRLKILLPAVILLVMCGIGATAFALPSARAFFEDKFYSLFETKTPDKTNNVIFSWSPIAQVQNSPYTTEGTSTATYRNSSDIKSSVTVDIPSFEVLSFIGATSTQYTGYAKDNSRVYFEGSLVSGADPSSFEVLPYQNHMGDYEYAKDVNHIYFGTDPIVGSDPSTFSALYYIEGRGDYGEDSYYAKDGNYVYSGSEVVSSLDPKSVSLVGDFIRDASMVYGGNQLIDPTTFVSLGNNFYKDKNNYYCDGYTILHVKNPSNFTVLTNVFAKDSQSVYSSTQCSSLANSDPASFVIKDGYDGIYAQDAHNVYINGSLAQGLSPDSFSVINKNYSKDASHVYFSATEEGEGGIIKDADPATFHVFGNSLYSADANKAYYASQPIKGAVPGSFADLNSKYAKDQNRVYFAGSPVEGADPITFVASTTAEFAGKDISGEYRYGDLISTNSAAPSPILVAGIQKARGLGMTDDQIRAGDSKVGWTDTELDAAFGSLPPNTNSPTDPRIVSIIVQYIATARKGGYDDSVIRSQLIFNNMTTTQIDTAFAQAGSVENVTVLAPGVYSKDSVNVYCNGNILPGADPATFVQMRDKNQIATAIAKDSRAVYVMDSNACERVSQQNSWDATYTPDPATFQYVGGSSISSFYAKDKNYVYYWDGYFIDPVYGADVNTFTTNVSGLGINVDAKDKNYTYMQGRKTQ